MRAAALFFLLLAAYELAFPREVHAYLDAGSGSYLFQMLLAFLLGGMFTLKLYWRKFKGFILRIFSRSDQGSSNQARRPQNAEPTKAEPTR